jgi:hypothetical protein
MFSTGIYRSSPLGVQVCGDMRWCLMASLNLHMRWLLSACPDLLRAGRLVVVHDKGHRGRCV